MWHVSDAYLDFMTHEASYIIAFLLGALLVLAIDVIGEARRNRKAAKEEEEWWADGE